MCSKKNKTSFVLLYDMSMEYHPLPFYDNGKGRVYWGLCYNGDKSPGGTQTDALTQKKLILVCGAEVPKIIQSIKDSQYEIASVPGTGQKLMKVALGEACAYVLSKGTTFRWDTCAPHAIIRAKGGDVLDFILEKPITYNIINSSDNQQICNAGGIIAYINREFLEFKDSMI